MKERKIYHLRNTAYIINVCVESIAAATNSSAWKDYKMISMRANQSGFRFDEI